MARVRHLKHLIKVKERPLVDHGSISQSKDGSP